MVFSTLNESNLHNSLKTLYQEIYDGQVEVEQDGHVYDIVTKNGNIIEIQTKNLAKLMPKILDTIDKGHNVKMVHPIPITTRIELKDEVGKIISNRKSPKKGCIYDLFKELTGIYPLMTTFCLRGTGSRVWVTGLAGPIGTEASVRRLCN